MSLYPTMLYLLDEGREIHSISDQDNIGKFDMYRKQIKRINYLFFQLVELCVGKTCINKKH